VVKREHKCDRRALGDNEGRGAQKIYFVSCVSPVHVPKCWSARKKSVGLHFKGQQGKEEDIAIRNGPSQGKEPPPLRQRRGPGSGQVDVGRQKSGFGWVGCLWVVEVKQKKAKNSHNNATHLWRKNKKATVRIELKAVQLGLGLGQDGVTIGKNLPPSEKEEMNAGTLGHKRTVAFSEKAALSELSLLQPLLGNGLAG